MKKSLIQNSLVLLNLCVGVGLAVAGDPSGKADVLYNGGFNVLGVRSGHVGIWDCARVLEVGKSGSGINGSCVRNDQTLQSFKNDTDYRGARYETAVTSSQRLRVLDTGRKQADYWPRARYSLLLPDVNFKTSASEAWVMKLPSAATNYRYVLEKRQLTTPGYLRCDFFVAAAYREGAGKSFATRNFLPADVFYSFASAR